MIFAKFVVFIAVWTGAAGLLIGIIHPLAIFLVWIVGFLWGTGYIIGGTRDGDAAVIYTLGFFAAMAAIAAVVLPLMLAFS